MKQQTREKWLRILLCFLVYLSGSFSVYAGTSPADIPPSETVPNTVLAQSQPFEISLLTFSPSDNLFEWFGHTVLAVENRRTGKSTAYSFGGFSFHADDFLKFTMGKFIFWSYAEDTGRLLRYYRKKGRHIVIQKLDLSPRQTVRIRMRLLQSLQPQNRLYVYDHFNENCATRLRDIVDEALGGAIKKQSTADTGWTIRDYIQRMTAHQPALNFLLQFILSDGVDRPVTHWESMFLPDQLMRVFQNSTNPEPGNSLIRERLELIPQNRSPFFNEKIEIPQTSLREWIVGLGAGLIIAFLAVLYLKAVPPLSPVKNGPSGINSSDKLSAKIYPAVTAIMGGFFGLLGTILFFMAVIADHKDVYWNENFFLLNPLTITLLPLGLLRIFGRARRLFAGVSFFCGVTACTGIVLKLLPAFDQGNAQQIRVLLPMLLIIGLTGFFELQRSKSVAQL